MSLSRFQNAVKQAAAHIAPSLGLEPSQLEYAMLTIAGLEGGLGEEAGVGDGGASVGRFQFNTAGGHGSTLLNQGYSRSEIADDVFQAEHWAPILGQALKRRLDEGQSLDQAIIQAGFDVERPAQMYDPSRASNALATASSMSGMSGSGGSGSDSMSFGRTGFHFQTPPDGSSDAGTLSSILGLMSSAGLTGSGNGSGNYSLDGPGLLEQIANYEAGGSQGSTSTGSGPEAKLAAYAEKLAGQIADLQAQGKPVPPSLIKEYTDVVTSVAAFEGDVSGYQDYLNPGGKNKDTTSDLLNALANVYSTAVSSGSLKATAANNMLQRQLEQAGLLQPHDYKPGFGPGGVASVVMPGFNSNDWKTQKVSLDDPHLITEGADQGFQGILDAILGGGSGVGFPGGFGTTPAFGGNGGTSTSAGSGVPFSLESAPYGLDSMGSPISSSINAFLNEARNGLDRKYRQAVGGYDDSPSLLQNASQIAGGAIGHSPAAGLVQGSLDLGSWAFDNNIFSKLFR